jgi:hypothetical protein
VGFISHKVHKVLEERHKGLLLRQPGILSHAEPRSRRELRLAICRNSFNQICFLNLKKNAGMYGGRADAR